MNSAHHPDSLRRKTHFQCGISDDVALHTLEPIANILGDTINTFIAWEKEPCLSTAHTLLDVWLLPLRDPAAGERRATYERCVKIAKYNFPPWDETTKARYTALLLDRLATDEKAPAALAADVLGALGAGLVPTDRARADVVEGKRPPRRLPLPRDMALVPYLIRCALAFLGRDRDSDQQIAEMLLRALPLCHPADPLVVEACIRLTELDLPAPPLAHPHESSEGLLGTREPIANRRPDLVERLRRLTEERDSAERHT